MLSVHYQVIQDHQSEYPEPIHFVKGKLGSQASGWVPLANLREITP